MGIPYIPFCVGMIQYGNYIGVFHRLKTQNKLKFLSQFNHFILVISFS